MKILLSAFLIAVIIYLLPVIAFVLAMVFSIMIEPIKIMNSTWCAIIDYVRKHISKKREDKDISNLEL